MLAGRGQGFKAARKPCLICDYCGYKGHLKENCYKIIGITSVFSKAFNYDWIIDIGASHHVTPYKEVLDNVRKIENQNNNVVQVPTTGELSCCPAFFPDFCMFQDLYSGKKELNKELPAIVGNIVQVQEDSALWHSILDHPSTVAMQHIPLLKNKMNTKLQYGCKNQEEVDIISMNSDPLATDAVEETGGISPEGDAVNDVRKSARPSRPPIWIKDYVTTWTFIGNSLYPISQGLLYANLTVGYQSYLKAFSAHIEPGSFKEVVQDSRWVEEMQREISALEEKKNTWKLVDMPQGKQTIGSKWVYKIKHKANGEVERFKARLVDKGYNQNEGLDYHDTSSPVAKVVTVRTIISIAAAKGKRQGSDMVIILVYVDDLLITESSPQLVNDAKKTLQSQFKVKDLGELRYFLGIEVLRSQTWDSTEPKKICT
nr:uncharacterized protein LOC108944936 [Nicotiana tomentosiformis]